MPECEDGPSTGQPASFDAFFRAEQPRMVALAYALTGSREVALDLAQESLFRAYQRWHSVSGLAYPGAWVRRTTINAAMDWHRRNRRWNSIQARLIVRHVDPPNAIDAKFWEAVRRLPRQQRIAVALYYVEDRSIDDVAAVMGVASGTVKATLSAARARLNRILTTDDKIEPT